MRPIPGTRSTGCPALTAPIAGKSPSCWTKPWRRATPKLRGSIRSYDARQDAVGLDHGERRLDILLEQVHRDVERAFAATDDRQRLGLKVPVLDGDMDERAFS